MQHSLFKFSVAPCHFASLGHRGMQQNTQPGPWSQNLETKKGRSLSVVRALLCGSSEVSVEDMWGDGQSYLTKERHLGPDSQDSMGCALCLGQRWELSPSQITLPFTLSQITSQPELVSKPQAHPRGRYDR